MPEKICPICEQPLERYYNIRDEDELIYVCWEPQCPNNILTDEDLEGNE